MPTATHSATVTATARGIVPRPAEMPPGARLERASWDMGGIPAHIAGPGFWWMDVGAARESLRIAAPFAAGADVTLHWTE
jgi:hypothetical protein